MLMKALILILNISIAIGLPAVVLLWLIKSSFGEKKIFLRNDMDGTDEVKDRSPMDQEDRAVHH